MGNNASTGAFENFERQCTLDKYLKTDMLQTGDILLYHPNCEFKKWSDLPLWCFEKAIMAITRSEYSHASIIIRDPDFTSPPLKGLYVLESNHEYFPDAENNEIKTGVELVHLEDVLNTYSGTIYWRKLICERNENFYNALAEAHSVVHNRPYDLIPSDWCKAALKLNFGKTQRKKTFWCSALVSYIYTQLGFLPSDTPWTLISPKMLGTETGSNELEFKNCTLEKEQPIIF